jgi:GR25 family glycosyltransferase involved in LPS biosynthesis
MSNSDDSLVKTNYSKKSFELNMNDSSDKLEITNESKLSNFELLSYESNNEINSNDFDSMKNEFNSIENEIDSIEKELNENSFSKEINLDFKSKSVEESKIDKNVELFEFDSIKNSDESLIDNRYDNLILTMKITLDKNNLNNVIIPDNISIDKLVKMSRDNYLNEIENMKKKEIDNLKKEIREINTNKFDSIFKNIMESYNLNLDRKIDQIYKQDKLSQKIDNISQDNSKNVSEIKFSQEKYDSDPFVMDYQMINTKVVDSKSDSFNEVKLNKEKKIIAKKSNRFNDYFDCVYIINLPNERDKIDKLTNIFNDNRVKYKIIDGIIAKSDTKYMKYYQRWLYQKNLNEKFMNKFIFDEKLYLKKNPDLVGLNNKSKCWIHWIKEGRNSNRKLYDKTNILLDSQLGNLIAHMNVIKDAKFENYNNILILEDDVYIHSKFNELHLELINKINKNYNLLFYGGIQKKWSEINIENNFYRANNTYGAFAYAIKSNIYEILLERMNYLVDPMDKLLVNLQNILKSCYVSYPNIFITDLENGKIHRKRDMEKYSKHFKWELDNYKM